MRLALKIIFVLLITAAKAQPSKSDCPSITKADLVQKKKISDFAPSFPKGSVITSYEFLYYAGGKRLICTGNSDSLSEKCKEALRTVDFGSDMHLDIFFRQRVKGLAESRCYKIIKR